MLVSRASICCHDYFSLVLAGCNACKQRDVVQAPVVLTLPCAWFGAYLMQASFKVNARFMQGWWKQHLTLCRLAHVIGGTCPCMQHKQAARMLHEMLSTCEVVGGAASQVRGSGRLSHMMSQSDRCTEEALDVLTRAILHATAAEATVRLKAASGPLDYCPKVRVLFTPIRLLTLIHLLTLTYLFTLTCLFTLLRDKTLIAGGGLESATLSLSCATVSLSCVLSHMCVRKRLAKPHL